MKRAENRSEEEIRTLRRLKTVHYITQRCCTLFEEFATMLRDQDDRNKERGARRRLEAWTERARASGIAEPKGLAVKLLQDTEGVVAAMMVPYSQGQTEGRVNNLKLVVKRSMYGGGKFDLPRQRVHYEASWKPVHPKPKAPGSASSNIRKNHQSGSSPVRCLTVTVLARLPNRAYNVW